MRDPVVDEKVPSHPVDRKDCFRLRCGINPLENWKGYTVPRSFASKKRSHAEVRQISSRRYARSYDAVQVDKLARFSIRVRDGMVEVGRDPLVKVLDVLDVGVTGNGAEEGVIDRQEREPGI